MSNLKTLTLASRFANAMSKQDRQSLSLTQSQIVNPYFVEIFEKIFSGQDILVCREKIEAVTNLSNTIRTGHVRQLEIVLSIGRALLTTEKILNEAEWKILMESSTKLFNLNKTVASQYRAIARDIDSGRIPREICPESFTTAYVLTTYPEVVLTQALDKGIITPSLTRKEAVRFKKDMLASDHAINSIIKLPKEDIMKVIISQRSFLQKEKEKLLIKLEDINIKIDKLKIKEDRILNEK
ncbi:hypothetical protein PT277_10080 [Acetobacteraceae bacterium ESL0709]|nr:hypothetical protein [Acetobacteraceae bacterium ESL0697]MDF7679029.1 hypothetical protein [Acetobacteraceae bacterium ESL0709]